MQEEERPGVAAPRRRAQPVALEEAQRRDWQQRFNGVPAMRGFGARVDLADTRHLGR